MEGIFVARRLSLAALLVVAAAGSFALAQSTPDYEPRSRLRRDLALKQAPRFVEDLSGWNKTTPIPQKLRLPGLQRTTIKVGDHLELAHGAWKRVRLWMENPDKDFTLRVTEFKP